MQARILPGRGKGGPQTQLVKRQDSAFPRQFFQSRPQFIEIVDDALHDQLRCVVPGHRSGNIGNAAIGEQTGQNIAVR